MKTLPIGILAKIFSQVPDFWQLATLSKYFSLKFKSIYPYMGYAHKSEYVAKNICGKLIPYEFISAMRHCYNNTIDDIISNEPTIYVGCNIVGAFTYNDTIFINCNIEKIIHQRGRLLVTNCKVSKINVCNFCKNLIARNNTIGEMNLTLRWKPLVNISHNKIREIYIGENSLISELKIIDNKNVVINCTNNYLCNDLYINYNCILTNTLHTKNIERVHLVGESGEIESVIDKID